MGSRGLRGVAAVVLAGLLVAACGGGDDDGGSGGAAAGTTTGGGTAATAGQGGEDEAPVRGGRLVIGLIAESSQGWNPATGNWAISGHMVARSFYDTLLSVSEDGEVLPNLAESFEPNADFTEWRIRARDGVTFHNGEAFDGAAICANLTTLTQSALTGIALALVDAARLAVDPADPQTCVVGLKAPWAAFDTAMVSSQGSYMAAPATLSPTAQTAEPVGTGPFEFVSWSLDNNLVVRRNPDHWLPGADGQPLPYLDEIEFRVIPDHGARVQALRAGEIDVMQTDQGVLVNDLREDAEAGDLQVWEHGTFGSTAYIMLNNAVPPLDDVRVRRALAHATDVPRLIDINGGVAEQANGPFRPGAMGHLEDTGYPELDPAAAEALIEEVEAERGDVRLTLGTVAGDPINTQNVEELQAQWEAVGVDVDLELVEEQKYIGNALVGQFQAYAWRNLNGFDPDQQHLWWHSVFSSPVGSLALNFGRFKDPEIDAALQVIRASDDEAARTEAAEEINRRFGEQAYNIWLSWPVWAIAAGNHVRGLDQPVSPDDAGQRVPMSEGTFQLAQIWMAGS